MIAPCKCVHEFQDLEHGKGMRVWNKRQNAQGGMVGRRCTVCCAEKEEREKL